MQSGESHVVKCALLLCSVDLPAKAAVCNMLQFNAKQACVTCLDPGDNRITWTPMHRVWPHNPSPILRTTSGVSRAVQTAVQYGVVC